MDTPRSHLNFVEDSSELTEQSQWLVGSSQVM